MYYIVRYLWGVDRRTFDRASTNFTHCFIFNNLLFLKIYMYRNRKGMISFGTGTGTVFVTVIPVRGSGLGWGTLTKEYINVYKTDDSNTRKRIRTRFRNIYKKYRNGNRTGNRSITLRGMGRFRGAITETGTHTTTISGSGTFLGTDEGLDIVKGSVT